MCALEPNEQQAWVNKSQHEKDTDQVLSRVHVHFVYVCVHHLVLKQILFKILGEL
jgi:hypothetical protein